MSCDIYNESNDVDYTLILEWMLCTCWEIVLFMKATRKQSMRHGLGIENVIGSTYFLQNIQKEIIVFCINKM